MSDLISRSALIKEIEDIHVSMSGIRCGKGMMLRFMHLYMELVLKTIIGQPTAFELEKVLEELEEAEKYHCSHCIDAAIDIVKEGVK